MEELIYKYFPTIGETKKNQIKAMGPLYREWNQKINVISRKDIGNLYLHHILHSLAIAKHTTFPNGSSILDVGTGGGFPGIPLAIMFPECNFYLCDSIRKKIKVVNEIKESLGLKNVVAKQIRAEEVEQKFDFVVSRAVTDLSTFLPWIWKKIRPSERETPRGLLYLKGGVVNEEIVASAKKMNINFNNFSKTEVQTWFKEEWFQEKCIIFIKR